MVTKTPRSSGEITFPVSAINTHFIFQPFHGFSVQQSSYKVFLDFLLAKQPQTLLNVAHKYMDAQGNTQYVFSEEFNRTYSLVNVKPYYHIFPLLCSC